MLVSQHNPAMRDIEQALTGSLPRDGRGPMLGPLVMGGNRISGIGPGIAPGDAATIDQIATADNNYPDLTTLKAATPARLAYVLATDTGPVNYAYVIGDFTGKADNVNVVKLDVVPLATGALVRQGADSLTAQRKRTTDSITGIIRNAQTEFNEAVKFTQFALPGQPAGAGNKAWDTQAMNRAVIYAMDNGRSVEIPDNDVPFKFGNIVLPKNEQGTDGDIARPTKFTIHGAGAVVFDGTGFLFDCTAGVFYDLVIAGGLRFEATGGGDSKFINGEKFIRLVLAPGLQINKFRWGVYCDSSGAIGAKYLQSVRATAVIFRGQAGLNGVGAFIKAPMAYDLHVNFCIIEFGSDGIVIDGQGGPAFNVGSLSYNVIEGMGGRGIVVGACLGVQIHNNYMEGNLGGEIFTNAGTQSHIGISIQGNGLQAHASRIAAGAYSIVWNASLTVSATAGGNYSTGNLHDLTGASGLLNAVGDVVAAGSNVVRPGIGRYVTTNAFTFVYNWFGQSVWLDPYLQEVAFFDQYTFEGEPVVRTHGTNSPANDAAQFARKKWAKGSQVDSVAAANTGDAVGWICTVSGTPGTWRPVGLLP